MFLAHILVLVVALQTLGAPIPLRAENAATALNYHSLPVDLSNPLSNEPLVKASDYDLSATSFYYINDGSNLPYGRRIPGSLADVWLRKSVAEKLVRVNQSLAPSGLEVHIYDGFRPVETQRALWNYFVDVGRKRLHTNDRTKLIEFAGRFASRSDGFDPANSQTWPTHTTGGAVDLTLQDKATGKLLDMGGRFDEASPASYTDALEREPSNKGLGPAASRRHAACSADSNDAKNNRRILYTVMTKEGFANYPYEWWHYDWGTQMWLQNSGEAQSGEKAWYGPAFLRNL